MAGEHMQIIVMTPYNTTFRPSTLTSIVVPSVRGEQDRGLLPVSEPVHEVVEVASGRGVEAGRRLVEEQQLGPPHDADRHVAAAPLPAGQGTHPLARVRGQPDRLDQVIHVPGARDARRGVRRVVAAQVREQLADMPALDESDERSFNLAMGRIAGVTGAETRERLLSAAAGVFAERGYDGTRVTEISAAAGVSNGAMPAATSSSRRWSRPAATRTSPADARLRRRTCWLARRAHAGRPGRWRA
jgi:hypothetical protein